MKTVKLLALLVFILAVTGCGDIVTCYVGISQPPILYTVVNNSSTEKTVEMSSIFIWDKEDWDFWGQHFIRGEDGKWEYAYQFSEYHISGGTMKTYKFQSSCSYR